MGSSSSEVTPKSNSSASQCRRASASYAAIGSHSGVGSRLSGIESMEEAKREEEEGGEEEEEEESPKELELDEEEMAMAGEGLGFSALLALGRRRACGERSRFERRLNSENWRWIGGFTFYEEASCRDVASSLTVAVRFNEH